MLEAITALEEHRDRLIQDAILSAKDIDDVIEFLRAWEAER